MTIGKSERDLQRSEAKGVAKAFRQYCRAHGWSRGHDELLVCNKSVCKIILEYVATNIT